MRAHRASSTAAWIARALALVSRERRFAPVVPPDLALANDRLLAGIPGGAGFRRALEHAPVRALLLAAERRLLPGIALHYLLRKRRLEELVRTSLDAGISRVVVLGAGFDTLALRLHREYPAVSFVEVDHPATQRAKRRGLEGCGELRSNLRLLPCDLRAGAHGLLLDYAEADGHDGLPTIAVAEGLLMYLSPTMVNALFASFGRSRSARRIVFTFMAASGARRTPRFADASPLVDHWLRLRGEPFRWGCPPIELAALLGRSDWKLALVEGSDELRRRYLAGTGLLGEPLAVGEEIAVAEATLTR